MTTTISLRNRKNSDFYMSRRECVRDKARRVQTNYRYRNFRQNHFTAGSEDQFEQYRDATNGDNRKKDIDLSANLFADKSLEDWGKNKNIPASAVIDTFRYIFNKFKKGIFVKIKGGKVVVFLPFSKSKFTNEWSSKVMIDPKFKRNSKFKENSKFKRQMTDIDYFLKAITGKGYTYKYKKVNQNMNEWYSNNCIVRYDVDSETQLTNEGDTNVSTIQNMLEELCKNREIPDIEFFMNRRDFPIITRDGKEPYKGIWGDQDLVSHNYEKYAPILSMCKTDEYADVLSPTHEDWARSQSKKGRFFTGSCGSYNDTFNTLWEDKKPTAVFRGASTGCGVTVDSNPRLKLAYISATTETKEGEIPLLDAGITKWNARPRKLSNSPYLQSIDIANIGFGLVNSLTRVEQSTYKYIVNVDGHVSAFRLSMELGMGSVILLAKSKWKMWYSDMLVPYEHFVPVKEDLSDLLTQIQWCRDRDKKCKEIAENATVFFNTYIQENGIFDYLQKTLVDLKEKMGVYLYNTRSPLSHQIESELKSLTLSFPETTKRISDINEIPDTGRCYGLLQGVHQVLNMAQDSGNLMKVLRERGTIFANKLGVIKKYTLGKKNPFGVVIKRTTDSHKKLEHSHEVFVGTKAINDLIKFIPNFAYTFGLYTDREGGVSVINEFIPGRTLFDYLNDKKMFNFKEYVGIILQLCLAIQTAQQNCSLVHYDLLPWNIILYRVKEYVKIEYVIGEKVIRIKTKVIPVIIDYGKSHVIVEGEHHGFINMFNVSIVQDVLMLLLKSLKIIIDKQQLSGKDYSFLLIMANFISGTKYRRDLFKTKESLISFLTSHTSYTSLISDNKHEMESKTPKDLFNYIHKNVIDEGYKISEFAKIGTVTVYNSLMDHGNSRQIFEYILSSTDEERAQTYFNVFSRLKHCTIPQPDNLLLIYYTVQSFHHNLKTVNKQMMDFLNKTSNLSRNTYIEAYEDSVSFLDRVYRPKLIKLDETTIEQRIEYRIDGDFSSLIPAPYTQETFLVPERVSQILSTFNKNTVDLSSYREIIIFILVSKGPYNLETKDKNHYLKNLGPLISINPLYMQNNTANVNTLCNLSRKVYEKDMSVLDKNNPLALKFIHEYENILEQIKSFI